MQLYVIKYSYQLQIILNRSIWPIDETLKGAIILGLSGPGNNGS